MATRSEKPSESTQRLFPQRKPNTSSDSALLTNSEVEALRQSKKQIDAYAQRELAGWAAGQIVLTLTPDEAAELLATTGEGGNQSFQKWLIDQLSGENLQIAFNDEQLGKLIRYMTQYGRGGFQSRLHKAFRRSMLGLLDP